MIPKFRCWDADTQKMNGMVEIYRNKDNTIKILPRDRKITLMQSTGLFDKNGVEIFEGDVVKDDEISKEIYICKRSAITPRLELQTKDKFIVRSLYENDVKNLEVIGNIYNNPELVEVENA